MRHNGTGTLRARLLGDSVHKCIVVRGLVMKHHERPHISSVGQRHARLPGGVPPAFEVRILFVGLRTIVNEYVGADDEVYDVLVQLTFDMFGISHITD